MGVIELEVAGKRLSIHEHEDVSDPETGRALTGSWLWQSAIHLVQWMSNQVQPEFDFQGKTVVELGAGTGLPGQAAAVFGADRVILTDIGPLQEGLRRNVEVNGLAHKVEVRELVWGSEELWGIEEVDLILMSDVFFDADQMVGLAKTLRGLCGAGTKIWSASEIRSNTSQCLEVLTGEGFGVVDLPSLLPLDDDEETMERTIFSVFVLELPLSLCN